MKNSQTIEIKRFILENGKEQKSILLSYQSFGLPIGTGPVIVVNHSLTGNSNSGGAAGWWKECIGNKKAIDTLKYTVITFNIPGNEYEEIHGNGISNYRDFTIRDIAGSFWEGIFYLKINSLYAVIGGELGGAIALEMAALQPNRIEKLIPIATHWKSTDRTLATILLQEQLLTNSEDPLVDARYYATLYYRNTEYVNQLFKRSNIDANSIETIETCIDENNPSKIKGYRMMNYLMKSNDLTRNRVDFESILKTIKGAIYSIGIETDGLLSVEENRKTAILMKNRPNSWYQEFKSDYSQNAYIFESERIAAIIQPILEAKSIQIPTKNLYSKQNYSMIS